MTKKSNKRKNSKVDIDKDLLSYTRKAYMAVRLMFANNEIGPRQKIDYREIAKRLGMSSTPVVQALHQLLLQGLVKHIPNRGYYSGSLSLKEVDEIYELREILEVSLISKTIKSLDDEGIKQLEASLEAELQAAEDIYLSNALIKSIGFHLTLASLSKCSVQQQVLHYLFDLLFLKYRSSLIMVTPKDYKSSHEDIYNAVVSRDPKKAQKLLSKHISEVREYFISALSQKTQYEQTSLIDPLTMLPSYFSHEYVKRGHPIPPTKK